jgi:hypothetical protein
VSFWQAWRDRRALRDAADAYTRAAWVEPDEADVRWLAALATGDDDDHARWELRYCRRALALLTAEREALDDRTVAAVAHALVERLHRDRSVAAERVPMAERQFNTRLSRYREALRERGAGGPAERIAAALLAVAGGGHPVAAVDPRAVALVEGYGAAARERLRACFGVAQLPEHVRPSEAFPEPRR